MDEDIERIFELAREGRYSEARKYIQETELSKDMKARLNASIWQMENSDFHFSPSQPDIPKLPVISMILGFVLIIAAFFIEGSPQSFIVITGLVMAGVIPTIYCLREKYQNDKDIDKREYYAHKYDAEGADLNFPWRIPSAGVIITTLLGIGLMLTACYIYGNTDDDVLRITAAVLLTAGFAVMTISRILANSYNGILMWSVMTISALLVISGVAAVSVNDENIALPIAFISAASLYLMFYPLIYKIIMKRLCTEEVEAECVDVQIVQGRRSDPPRYRGIWKYEFNGTTYVHRDRSKAKSPVYNEIRLIRISPKSPHNIYMGGAPTYSLLYFAAGFFILIFFLIFLMPLA